jgi:DNA-binding CsgD family transcriptional regulator
MLRKNDRRGYKNRWCPTAEQRAQVEEMAAQGVTRDAIAIKMGVDPATLRKHCLIELERGKARNKSALFGILMKHAVNTVNPNASITSAKYLLATRHRVYETDQSIVTALEAKVAQLEAQIAAQAGAEDADLPDVEITQPNAVTPGAPAFDINAALRQITGRLN